jgi:hypothetical protein
MVTTPVTTQDGVDIERNISSIHSSLFCVVNAFLYSSLQKQQIADQLVSFE